MTPHNVPIECSNMPLGAIGTCGCGRPLTEFVTTIDDCIEGCQCDECGAMLDVGTKVISCSEGCCFKCQDKKQCQRNQGELYADCYPQGDIEDVVFDQNTMCTVMRATTGECTHCAMHVHVCAT